MKSDVVSDPMINQTVAANVLRRRLLKVAKETVGTGDVTSVAGTRLTNANSTIPIGIG